MFGSSAGFSSGGEGADTDAGKFVSSTSDNSTLSDDDNTASGLELELPPTTAPADSSISTSTAPVWCGARRRQRTKDVSENVSMKRLGNVLRTDGEGSGHKARRPVSCIVEPSAMCPIEHVRVLHGMDPRAVVRLNTVQENLHFAR